MSVDFIPGKAYLWLCSHCRKTIDQFHAIYTAGCSEDTDDREAPCNAVYDRSLFCGGRECINKAGDAQPHLPAQRRRRAMHIWLLWLDNFHGAYASLAGAKAAADRVQDNPGHWSHDDIVGDVATYLKREGTFDRVGDVELMFAIIRRVEVQP